MVRMMTARHYWRIFQQPRMIVCYDSDVTEGKCGMQMCVPKGSKNPFEESWSIIWHPPSWGCPHSRQVQWWICDGRGCAAVMLMLQRRWDIWYSSRSVFKRSAITEAHDNVKWKQFTWVWEILSVEGLIKLVSLAADPIDKVWTHCGLWAWKIQ